jgi:hypothetical protein
MEVALEMAISFMYDEAASPYRGAILGAGHLTPKQKQISRNLLKTRSD